MSNQNTEKQESLVNDGLKAVMENRSAETPTTVAKKVKKSDIAVKRQKMILQQRRKLMIGVGRWICFLAVLAVFLHWAAGEGLMQTVISTPGICICAAVGGYQLGSCQANLRQLPVVRKEAA